MVKQTEWSYSLFGLAVRSNLPVPGLSHTEVSPMSPGVRLSLGMSPDSIHGLMHEREEPFYESSFLAPNGDPALRIWRIEEGAFLRLSYFDGMQFWVDRKGQNIWGCWPDELSIEDAATYLLGPVLGLSLRLRGVTCLHASAVTLRDQAVAFMGAPGAGKSTTAAAMARKGHMVISDDIVALSEAGAHFEVLPSYRHLSLWPEPVSTLYGSADAVPRFVSSWDKRRLSEGSHGLKFEERTLPLGAIYVLGERQEVMASTIAPLSAETAFLTLVANTYATSILDPEMRASEFRVLGRLIESVPTQRLSPVQDLQQLDELCSLIADDFAQRATGPTEK
jgi:hypothetical protein